MTSLPELLQQGTAHAWLFIPTAILLGALHGLEPGHSKTMMAAFIIAVQGTVTQAILLGLSAAISHTAVVWVVALGGQYVGRSINAEATEPYFQLSSAVIVAAIALWMAWRTWRDVVAEKAAHHRHGHHHGHAHGHHHGHDHHHHGHDEVHEINTGHGRIALSIFEEGVPPRFRVSTLSGPHWRPSDVTLTTVRPDGTEQEFRFDSQGDFLESTDAIPEPHTFKARLSLSHGDHAHVYELAYSDDPHAEDDEAHEDFMDAHEKAHANDIARRFSGRPVTTGQIIMFGLTGGLVPCPAAITVLLLCLQLKQLSLGIVLVVCFSIGLAITMVSAGVIASLSVKHIASRWKGFGGFARRAPYASALLMLVIALYMAYSGWAGLAALTPPAT